MDAFSVSISIGLQYGVPLEAFVSKYMDMRCDPAGTTDDADIRIAQSVMDYLFRRLALDYPPVDERAELGIFSAEERAVAVATGSYSGSSDSRSDLDVEGLGQSVPVEARAAAPAAAAPAPAEVGSSTELPEAMQGIGADAPLCMTCETKMRRAGNRYVCEWPTASKEMSVPVPGSACLWWSHSYRRCLQRLAAASTATATA